MFESESLINCIYASNSSNYYNQMQLHLWRNTFVTHAYRRQTITSHNLILFTNYAIVKVWEHEITIAKKCDPAFIFLTFVVSARFLTKTLLSRTSLLLSLLLETFIYCTTAVASVMLFKALNLNFQTTTVRPVN